MSRRTDILAELENRLCSMAHAASDNVYAWYGWQRSNGALPAISYRDMSRSVEKDHPRGIIGQEVHALGIDIEARVRGSETHDDTRDLVETVRAAVYTDISFGGLVLDLENWKDDIDFGDDDQGGIGTIKIAFSLIYRLPIGQS